MPHTDPASPFLPPTASELASTSVVPASSNVPPLANPGGEAGGPPLPAEEDTFSRTVLVLAPPDLAWVNALASPADGPLVTALPSVLTAIEPLVAMVVHLRSPQGDWPPDVPQTPANLYPYVADEAYEALNAYESLLAMPLGEGASPPPTSWTLQELAPRLLWAIAHSSPALMSLLSGVTASLLTATGEWQQGLLRLVVTLTATPVDGEATPWTVDLAVQRPPLLGVAPDRRLRLGSALSTWREGTVGQLLTDMLTLVEQDQPGLAPWFRGVTGDWLTPGADWRSGTLTLQWGVEFIPLPTLVAAATRGQTARPVPAAVSPQEVPVAGVSVPLSLADLNREGESDLEGETTIFFLDEDDLTPEGGVMEPLEAQAQREVPEQASVLDRPLDGVASLTESANLDAIADTIADEVLDLVPPFPATPLAETTVTGLSTPTVDPDSDQEVVRGTQEEPPELSPLDQVEQGSGETASVALPPDLATEFAPDPTDAVLITAATMFPDLPGINPTSAETGPIAQVGWPGTSPVERPDLWREVLLQRHLLAQLPSWQALAQTSARESADPDPVLLALIETAGAIGHEWEHPESWLLPVDQGLAQASSYALGDWLLGLFWSVTRSAYTIAQLVGGVYAQVLVPEQGWRTGTLRLAVTLTIATEGQTWHWDLATRQGLATLLPGLHSQAVICFEHLAAYPMPILAGTMHAHVLAQLRASDPRFMAWEAGLPLRWQAMGGTDWQLGQWHLTSSLEFVATR